MQKFFFILLFLFLYQNIYSNEVPSFNWYWVFYESEESNSSRSFVIRPFYLENINTKNNNIFTASLIPVLFWEYESKNKTDWKSLFGLIGSVDYVHTNGIRDYDFGAFPFILYGKSPDARDKYLHIWPFGGVIKGKLGQDKIKTIAFPGVLLFFVYPIMFPPTWMNIGIFFISLIPAYVDYESRDYKAHGILWPLIQWGTSPTRDDKRIIPFYAHNYKKDTYDNYSILMIFNYGKAIMKNDEERTFFAFPFFGRRWNISSIRNSGTLLWPFFSWGYDIKRGAFELNFPWPIVQWQTSHDPHIIKRIFFPFFGKYIENNKEMFFMTPLYISLKKESDSFDSEYYINALIIWYFKREYKKEPSPEYGTSWRYFKIWPLFQFEYDDRGNSSFNLLSLFPFRDPDGYEKLYQPFWTLFEYKRLESGEKRLGLFLRIYFQRWNEDLFNVKMPLLFSYGTSKNSNINLSFMDYCNLLCYNSDKDGNHIGLLFSMFSYSNDKDGNYIRLFWIPIYLQAKPDKKSDTANIKVTNEETEDGIDSDENKINYYYDILLFSRNKIKNEGEAVLYTGRFF
jgi:hypothetical protein